MTDLKPGDPVYVTRYALTGGIFAARVIDNCRDSVPNGRLVAVGKYYAERRHFHRPDWHTTPEAAIARAEKMRQEKLVSLRRQIAKLEAMTFTVDKIKGANL